MNNLIKYCDPNYEKIRRNDLVEYQFKITCPKSVTDESSLKVILIVTEMPQNSIS